MQTCYVSLSPVIFTQQIQARFHGRVQRAGEKKATILNDKVIPLLCRLGVRLGVWGEWGRPDLNTWALVTG